MRHISVVLSTIAISLLSVNSSGQDLIVPFNSVTNYFDEFQEPADQGALGWEDLNYNDSSWDTGPAELGYGDGDEATVTNTVLTAYFRKTFSLPNLCNYNAIEMTLIMDDGAVIYVNGVEVDRFNMNSGPVFYNTFSNATVGNNAVRTSTISTAFFNSGTNVIAVEMHQRSTTSSDISYDLQLEGILSSTPCTCINGMILDVDNDGICDDIDNCIGTCEIELDEFSLCSIININQIADDLSGVAYNNDLQRLVIVENGTPRAYELDLSGNVIRTLFLNNFEDTEGITYIGNNQYFIIEERKRDIVRINIPPGNNNITINNPGTSSRISLTNEGNDDQNDGLEGITYDRVNDIIYTVKEKGNTEVYEITNAMSRLGSNYFAPRAFDVTALASTYPGSYTDLAGISLTSFGTLLLLTEEGDRVVEVDAGNGSFISTLDLAPSNTPQPEGLTVISNGEIIVVGETNEFLTYKRVGGTCNDNNACTINDIINTNCQCVGSNQDSDNDGVCDGLDSCPNLNNNLIGTSCSDGDPCTINDVWQSNCSCAGSFLDTDNDGICDGQDSCPNLNNALIGQPCNDGNACTNGDTWQSNCMCVGTGNAQDSDNDGICDNVDSCPNLNNALIGMPCSDGDPCTTNDVWQSNCTCVGTGSAQDSDNDGVCDGLDICPNFDDTLIGLPCNDGNVCTTGDVWQSNCSCAGAVQDTDNDGVCDGLDVCPNFDDTLIGLPCNDGNLCTTGDVWQSNCSCTGVAQDSDNDGVCDGLDVCPNFDDTLIGLPCNDGNVCTTGDAWQSNCSCAGAVQDTDNDGVCDGLDVCPNLDDSLIGLPCNDGNSCTTGDTWQTNCQCQGIISGDADGDFLCDAIDNCPNVPNTNQADSDGNGIGDACDVSCQNEIIENDNGLITDNLVEAIVRVETNRILLAPLTTTYQAGQSVELTSGFEVELGATFTARIEACQ